MHCRSLMVVLCCTFCGSHVSPAAGGEEAESFLPAIRTYADNVLRYGRDVYGEPHTPLLVDGINIDSHQPGTWIVAEDYARKWNMPARWALSNMASQQNLFRVLVVLSEMTGDPKYKQAAVDATKYMFAHYQHVSGMLFWGGHAAVDLITKQTVGEFRTDGLAGKHEFKSHYPFYELMWEVDPKATQRFIEAAWFNHVLQWDNLDMNRHGSYHPVPSNMWDQPYAGGELPFVGKGLTFMLTGSDLFYAGSILSQFTGDERPLIWSKRMAKRYVDVRDPRTGLGADNYSTEPTNRMKQQFGAEFGDRFTEATVTSLYGNRYTRSAICQLKLSERLGEKGSEYRQWAIEDLTAYARHAYDVKDNSFWATLIDGTRLTPADRKRDGYVELRWLEKRPATSIHLWAYALAYRLTGDPLMWKMSRNIAAGLKLGDLGEPQGKGRQLGMGMSSPDPDAIFALLELQQATHDETFFSVARDVGRQLLAREFHDGFFTPDSNNRMCRFDTITPLALLYLEATAGHRDIKLPPYSAGKSYFHCYFNGVRGYDNEMIYGKLKRGS